MNRRVLRIVTFLIEVVIFTDKHPIVALLLGYGNRVNNLTGFRHAITSWA